MLTNLATGESAAFPGSEWLRSSDPFDLELDAGTDEQARLGMCWSSADAFRRWHSSHLPISLRLRLLLAGRRVI